MGIENLEQRHDDLGAWILKNTQFWQPRPFTEAPCPWEDEFSDLARELRGLSLEAIEAYESYPGGYPSTSDLYNTLKAKALELTAIPSSGNTGTFTVKDRRGIKEKKWRQICAFAKAAHPVLHRCKAPGLLDWCGGKGHLGRSLALEHKRDLTLLDMNEILVTSGALLARDSGLECQSIPIDALSQNAANSLGPNFAIVALHACGQLNMTLAENTVSKKVPALVMAPCCYHRITGDKYQALSERGRSHGLELTRERLKLATTEQVRPSRSVLRTRHRWMTWRLGFDLLLRQASGIDQYTALPHFPATQSQLDFPDFCQKLAERFEKTLPVKWDADSILREAEDKARQRRGLALLRWLFRRPLELWLCLDRALFLKEAGYSVQLGQFCEREVSPRNLMIIAELDSE